MKTCALLEPHPQVDFQPPSVVRRQCIPHEGVFMLYTHIITALKRLVRENRAIQDIDYACIMCTL